MDRQTALRKVVRALLGLNVLIWLAFAAIVALGLHPALPDGERYRWGLAGLAAAGALVLGTLTVLLERHRAISFMVIVLLGIVAILTVLDEVGWVDLAFLIVTVLPAALLMHQRREDSLGSLGRAP